MIMRDSGLGQAIDRLKFRLRLIQDAVQDPRPFRVGHFYSPTLTRAQRTAAADHASREPMPERLPGINTNEEAQWRLLQRLGEVVNPMVSRGTCGKGSTRYTVGNDTYFGNDAVLYEAMLRTFKPKRVIEVGSGQSSALLLDVDERFLGGATAMTFIEPFPGLLESLAQPGELSGRLIASGLEETDGSIFAQLGEGDLLFIDSTHVSKTGSDVNHLLFELLPSLAPGVLVHIHDIHWPFEYPATWIRAGWEWNENYMLRAFLSENPNWEILLMNTFLECLDSKRFEASIPPLTWPDAGPHGSIWLRKLAKTTPSG